MIIEGWKKHLGSLISMIIFEEEKFVEIVSVFMNENGSCEFRLEAVTTCDILNLSFVQ